MESQKRLFVGYDLCEDFAQISCYSYKTFEPLSLCNTEDNEDSLIPTVLCVNKDNKFMLFGEEANLCALKGEGVEIDHLLQKVKDKEEIEVFEEKYTAVDLLEKFLRKTLTLVKDYFPTEPISKLVVTIQDTDPDIINGIYEALSLLGIDKDRAVVMNHAGAYMYYALSQDRSLWTNDVGLFDYGEDGLMFYQISIKRRSLPMVAAVTKTDLKDAFRYDLLKQKDIDLGYIFRNLAENILYKKIISTLYFTGKGFEGDWAEEEVVKLCAGRRAFIGQNLYTKGACYAAKELAGEGKLDHILLLNENMITSSISLWTYFNAKQTEVLIVDAGIPWYEVNKSIEVIPDDEKELEFIFRNIMALEDTRVKLTLNPVPVRPNRMTRLEINISCIDKSTVKITVIDLGFGDAYPGTGILNEETVEIL